MLPERDRGYLEDMLAYSREASASVVGRTIDDLVRDRFLNLGLQRLIEIIGEAASRVSSETQAAYPEIEWGQIIGMRHRLVHGYSLVDLEVLWDTIVRDLPALIKELEAILPPPPITSQEE